MLMQQIRLGKTHVTIGAGKGLFTSVRSHMQFKLTQQSILLWAFLAMERHVAGVNFHVLRQ
jgi:hypothetical protein